jgi:hypothetical protein
MIAIRLTYNDNVDWVYPFPLSFLPSCHSLGDVKVVLRGPGMALTVCLPSACGKIVKGI